MLSADSNTRALYLLSMCWTNTIDISPDKLVYEVHYSAPVIVEHTLYVFGGILNDREKEKWQKQLLCTYRFY